MAQKYMVVPGYTVQLPDKGFARGGEIIEPTAKILADQGWKLTPVPEEAPAPEAPAPEVDPAAGKDVTAPPQDRAIKPSEAKKK